LIDPVSEPGIRDLAKSTVTLKLGQVSHRKGSLPQHCFLHGKGHFCTIARWDTISSSHNRRHTTHAVRTLFVIYSRCRVHISGQICQRSEGRSSWYEQHLDSRRDCGQGHASSCHCLDPTHAFGIAQDLESSLDPSGCYSGMSSRLAGIIASAWFVS
jgi:hypothetical protein